MIVTNGEQFGSKLSMPLTFSTTFNDLTEFLKSQLGEDKTVQLHIPDMATHTLPSSLKSAKLVSTILPSWILPLSVRSLSKILSLRIVSPTGDSSMVEICETDNISRLKEIISDKIDISVDNQVLAFPSLNPIEEHDNVNDDDDDLGNSLRDLGLPNNSTVSVSQKLKGGARSNAMNTFALTDIFNKAAIHDTKFTYSSNAKLWEAIGHGLVLSGTCGSSTCEAYSRTVNQTLRFGSFSFNTIKAKCPACNKPCNDNKIIDVSFNNCFYNIRGLDSEGKEYKISWTEVGDVDRSWDRSVAGIKQWLFVQVITLPLKRGMIVPGTAGKRAPVAKKCSICFCRIAIKNVHTDVEMRTCEHSFHKRCWRQWCGFRGNGGMPNVPCPICTEQ